MGTFFTRACADIFPGKRPFHLIRLPAMTKALHFNHHTRVLFWGAALTLEDGDNDYVPESIFGGPG
jgi:hypothetical protein